MLNSEVDFLITVGIAAFNEERTIGKVLENLLSQVYPEAFEILIVGGGSDKTPDVIQGYAERFRNIRFIREKERRGKPVAINEILKSARGRIIVIVDGDVFPAKGAIMKILQPFKDAKVGATCGQIVPLNDRSRVLGFWAHFLCWAAHRKRLYDDQNDQFFALSGSLCAFRRGIVKSIPVDSLADDAELGLLIRLKDYKIKYTSDAKVYIRYPQTLGDYLTQKRRIFAGFLQIRDRYGVEERSLSAEVKGEFLGGLVGGFSFCRGVKELWFFLVLCLVRPLAWFLAAYDYRVKRKSLLEIWKRSEAGSRLN